MARKVEVLRFLLLALRVLREAATAGNFLFLRFVRVVRLKKPTRFSRTRLYGLHEINTIVCDVIYD